MIKIPRADRVQLRVTGKCHGGGPRAEQLVNFTLRDYVRSSVSPDGFDHLRWRSPAEVPWRLP